MTDERVIPSLCVVGHPNQGKSSIVATLTENDSVEIGARSGTTRSVQAFRFALEGATLLELFDTPGFQRPAQLLDWLLAETVAPAARPDRIREFLANPELCARFPDEAALLSPVMAGSGILLVVDAAHPVGSADTAEMEILRWTGQPRMAVLNPVTQVAPEQLMEWQNTLGQYFQWVRQYDPMAVSGPARDSLLRALGELDQAWSEPVGRLIQGLRAREARRRQRTATCIAEYWITQMTARERIRPWTQGANGAQNRLFAGLQQNEAGVIAELKTLWGHASMDVRSVSEPGFSGDAADLMNSEYWYLWGLRRRELLLVSGTAGAATGAVVDASLGGSSFALGTLAGGAIGSVSAWWAGRGSGGKNEAENTEPWLPRLALKRRESFIGPVVDPNFPLVVMARALTLVQRLSGRSHARRDDLVLEVNAAVWPRRESARLLGWARRLQTELDGESWFSLRSWNARQRQQLESWIEQQLDSSADSLEREQ